MDSKRRSWQLPILVLSAAFAVVLSSPPLHLEPQVGFGDDDNFHIPAVFQQARFRLPRPVTPIHYKLDIQPILNLGGANDFTAPGHVTITVKCDEASQSIVLHSHSETTIREGDIAVKKLPENVDIGVAGFGFDTSTQALTINLDTELVVDVEYNIEIKFVSLVNEGQDGLYRSYHPDAEGVTRYIATTQFESIGARRCFPCFDEPALRATFDIRIGRLATGPYHTLGNTKIVAGTPEPIEGWEGWVWDEYERTPKMPTYLIAIIVSDFGFQEAADGLSAYDVRTYAPPNQISGDEGVYSADIQAKILTFFSEYFDSPYQLDKMYSVAVEVFAAGAMENWGLNTYRVPYMLWVKGESTQFEQWRQAAVISHELSHQWFGNLFTMTWWNDLWLKEGFARYLQFIGVRETDPDMEADKRYVLDCIQIAMENDILPTSHALHRPITDVLPSSNSRIIYEKGASLIRMMQGFLSEETLIAALRKFLKKYEYSHAIQAQLFEVLTEQAHEDGKLPLDTSVFDIMETWTERTGFPLIRVSRASSTRLFVSQEKFYANGVPQTEAKDLEPTDLWEVPITYATQRDPDFTSSNWAPKLWLHKNVALTSIVVDTTAEWILLNPDARSYYRVLYAEPLRGLIKEQLDTDHTVISVNSRSQLLDDYFVSAFNNYVGIQTALELTTFMDKEIELATWTTFFNKLRQLYTLLSDTPIYQDFKDYVLSKVVPQLERVQVVPPDDDKPIPAMLRAQLLDWACSMDPNVCADGATQLFAQWMATPDDNPIPADIQAVIYCAAVGASNGDSEVGDFVLERYYHASTTPRQRGLLFNSLACHNTVALLQGTLDTALDPTAGLNTGERTTLIQEVAKNTDGRDLVFQLLIDRTDDIISTINEAAIGSVVSTLSNYFSTSERIVQIQEYINANPELPASVISSLNVSKTRVEANKATLDRYYAGIEAFINSVTLLK